MALVMSFTDYVALYGTVSLTHDGAGSSAVTAGYSLTSLKTRQLGNVCRITRSGVGSTIIRIDFSQTTSTAMAAALLSLTTTSGNPFVASFKTFSTTTARTSSGTYQVATGHPWLQHACDLHDTPVGSINRLEVWLEPFVGTSTDIDIGRIWYGPAFQSYHSSGLAMDTGPEDSGGVELSRGGQAYPRIGVVSRTLTVPMPALEAKEVFGSAYAGSVGSKSTVSLESGAHTVGKTGAIIAFQENSANPMRPMYGHFLETPRFSGIAGGLFESSLSMREER